jgi:poly(ADP-ribose) glycohydrolase ARH3
MGDADLLHSKLLGSLLGAALGDAVGAPWEGQAMAADDEAARIAHIPGPQRYTDDTHMAIGIAESLIECGGFDGPHMAGRFVANYLQEPWRGYGPGPPHVFRLIRDGEPWDRAAASVYPGGSFGNGAAMRVAPVGLFYWDRPEEMREAARLSSIITHAHPLGVEGALLEATAVALAVAADPAQPLDVPAFVSRLKERVTEGAYRDRLALFGDLLKAPDDRRSVVRALGHGIEALNSVPTAIFCFLSHPDSFADTVIYAVSLGGDTDTIACMAGAISGAFLGVDALPTEWLAQLENRDYLEELAEELWRTTSLEGND